MVSPDVAMMKAAWSGWSKACWRAYMLPLLRDPGRLSFFILPRRGHVNQYRNWRVISVTAAARPGGILGGFGGLPQLCSRRVRPRWRRPVRAPDRSAATCFRPDATGPRRPRRARSRARDRAAAAPG